MIKAAYWFKKGAEQGEARSQYELGRCFLKGEGVEKNVELGFALLCKAAESNDNKTRSSARLLIQTASDMSYEEFVVKYG